MMIQTITRTGAQYPRLEDLGEVFTHISPTMIVRLVNMALAIDTLNQQKHIERYGGPLPMHMVWDKDTQTLSEVPEP